MPLGQRLRMTSRQDFLVLVTARLLFIDPRFKRIGAEKEIAERSIVNADNCNPFAIRVDPL